MDLSVTDPSIIYALFKGEPGVRKSTQALSFPGPQYWFSWDQKMQGLLVPMRKWGIDPKSIHYDDYTDWAKARAKLAEFELKCPYSTLVFDSITSMADMTLRQTMKIKGASGDTGKKIAGISVNSIEDYNAESSAINDLISTTKDIQTYHKSLGKVLNIILIAHVMEVTQKTLTGEMTQSRTIVTAGKRVAAKIPAYCSEVYHFGIKEGVVVGAGGKYVILTEHTGDDFARTALALPRELDITNDPIYATHVLPAINKLKGNNPPNKLSL